MNRWTKSLASYVGLVVVPVFAIGAILVWAPDSSTSETVNQTILRDGGWLGFFSDHLQTPISRLLVQLLVILGFSRICSCVLGKLGQPRVVGEIIAGVLLGKSVLAWVWPGAFSAIFPESSMPQLHFLSQIGLLFFIFVMGLELDLSEVKKRASTVLLVSHVSMAFPFFLGVLISQPLFVPFGPRDHSFVSFALFMGISMSVTAFPVLARILQEKRMTHTPLGTLALACAAVDDITAWCVLAAVIAIIKAGSPLASIAMIGASIAYIALMFGCLRPFLEKVIQPSESENSGMQVYVAAAFIVVFGSALLTEAIGIHALFGAFVAGAVMPRSAWFRSQLILKIEDLSLVVLLPIFSAYTGLRLEVGLLNEGSAWITCLGITGVAIFGKLLGSALAARWSGMSWRESWALGTLMNTRGLMELVVLNIGYDIGVLPPTIYTMLVLMTLITTAMTGPLLSMILAKRDRNT